jgi:hypothetical protein
MSLVTKVRQAMKVLVGATKNLKVSRDADVFTEIAFNFSFERANFNSNRQMGNFTIQYLVSPKPESTNTAPSVTYDQIIEAFDSTRPNVFKEAGLIMFSCSYEQGDIITDPVTGTVSLAFTINIIVTEKR